MAEEKKYKLKDPLVLILYALLLSRIINNLVDRLQNAFAGSGGYFSHGIWPFIFALLKFTSTLLSLFFATGLVYSTIRLTQLRTAERRRVHEAEQALLPTTASGKPRNLKWERVLQHIESENPTDWRLAILEADIVLDEMLEVIGYRGDTMGDKLKAVEKSDFTTIDLAWEAHKIRNQIAHEGSDFLITQRESKRIINMYKRVFEEFRYV